MLTLLADGLRNREIAEHLVISEATVKSHVRHVLEAAHPEPLGGGGAGDEGYLR